MRELERYLADPEFRFTVPLAPAGTPFQQRVWDALSRDPARRVAHVRRSRAHACGSAPRAVGQACGANRIALIMPCHRVVGARARSAASCMRPTATPIAIKRWLLTHEGYRFGLF